MVELRDGAVTGALVLISDARLQFPPKSEKVLLVPPVDEEFREVLREGVVVDAPKHDGTATEFPKEAVTVEVVVGKLCS